MLNKSEMNLLNKVMESSIEFKMEAYKMLGEELMKIQKQIAMLIGQPAQQSVVENVQPAKDTQVETKEEGKETKDTEVKTKQNKETKEKDMPKPNHKVSDIKKLTNCGRSEGENEVLFVEKRRDNRHLWYGQIRMNNMIRNFHWSNELPMPVVYGIENGESLEEAKELIRAAVKAVSPKELVMYDELINSVPESGGFHARQFMGALHQGAYIYLAPEADNDNIVAKGYTDGHAFIVRNDGEVFWRNYNYIFSKKPFESTPSKGCNEKVMVQNVEVLFNSVQAQYEKCASAYYRKQAKSTDNKTEDNVQQNKMSDKEMSDIDVSSLF